MAAPSPPPTPDYTRLQSQMTEVLDTCPIGQDLLRTIHLLARMRSYNAVGKHLAVNPGTVRRRIRLLEMILGEAIIHRSDTYGVLLTPFGRTVATYARPVVLDWVSQDK